MATPPDPLRYSASLVNAFEATGMLCERIPHGARLLDVGCGTGSISLLFKNERGADVVGIEPDERRAQSARDRGLNAICGYYDEEVAATLGRFDVIVFADVLEHVADPASLLERASRHLMPGGRIVASVPNVAHWTNRVGLLKGDFRYKSAGIMDATHLRWFTYETLQNVFASVNLKIADASWTSGQWMDEYREFPWRLIPESRLCGAIRRLIRVNPQLFGCQHVVTTVPA